MKDQESILKQLSQIKLPRVFRQNILLIFIFSVVGAVFYYPFFLFNRSKQLVKLQNIKRKYFYLITPFVGLITIFILNVVLVVVISNKENIPLGEFSSIKNLIDVLNNGKYPFATIINQVGLIFALLCFVVPLSDLLIQLSEKMKKIKTKFPKLIANTPAIFTTVGFLHIFIEVLKIKVISQASGIYILTNSIFAVTIVLSHIYLINVYVLFTAIKLPIQKGEIS